MAMPRPCILLSYYVVRIFLEQGCITSMRSIKATPIVIPPTLSTLVPPDKSILDGALFNSHGNDIDLGIHLDLR